MLSCACHIVFSTISRLHNFPWCFNHVNFPHMLHQPLNIRQRRLISFRTNAIPPQAVENDRLTLTRQLSEVALNAANTFSDRVFKCVSRIFKLKVALVPAALENLKRRKIVKNIRNFSKNFPQKEQKQMKSLLGTRKNTNGIRECGSIKKKIPYLVVHKLVLHRKLIWRDNCRR